MSSNRLRSDTCAYTADISQSTSSLTHVLDPMKYEHCQKCRHELGLVGGNEVSQIRGNLVDLENDLRGQTRYNTRCPQKKYQWNPATGVGGDKFNQPGYISVPGDFCRKHKKINAQMRHLKPCQMIKYDPVPLPPPLVLPKCARPMQQMQY
jgi:hypothetical protein